MSSSSVFKLSANFQQEKTKFKFLLLHLLLHLLLLLRLLLQLTIISEKLGKLAEEDLDFVTSEKAKRFMRKLPDKPPLPLRRQFPNTSPEALDLLGKMLQIHPRKRITVKEALKHPFMASLHSPDDEPEAETPFDFSFEDEKLYRVRLQEMIWQEIGFFRSSCLPVPARRNDVRSGRKESSRRLYHA